MTRWLRSPINPLWATLALLSGCTVHTIAGAPPAQRELVYVHSAYGADTNGTRSYAPTKGRAIVVADHAKNPYDRARSRADEHDRARARSDHDQVASSRKPHASKPTRAPNASDQTSSPNVRRIGERAVQASKRGDDPAAGTQRPSAERNEDPVVLSDRGTMHIERERTEPSSKSAEEKSKLRERIERYIESVQEERAREAASK